MTVPCQKEKEFSDMSVRIALIEKDSENQAEILGSLSKGVKDLAEEFAKLRRWGMYGVGVISGVLLVTSPDGVKVILELIKTFLKGA